MFDLGKLLADLAPGENGHSAEVDNSEDIKQLIRELRSGSEEDAALALKNLVRLLKE
jgi:hypothetical protein